MKCGDNMILKHKQCLELYNSDYMIKEKLKIITLFKIEKGLYSTIKNYSYLEVILTKVSSSNINYGFCFLLSRFDRCYS